MFDYIAEYKILLSTEEGAMARNKVEQEKGDWKLYPGDRRRTDSVQSYGPPPGSVLLRTGGNALQAVDLDVVLDQKNYEQQNSFTMISVVVPEGKEPGDTLLVQCPSFGEGEPSMISTFIPEGSLPGHVFLVQIPTTMPLEVVTGVPVDQAQQDASSQRFMPTNATPIVSGYDMFAAAAEEELQLREEQTRRTQTRSTTQPHGQDSFEHVEGASTNSARQQRQTSEDGFEMAPNRQNRRDPQRGSTADKSWVAAHFMGSFF